MTNVLPYLAGFSNPTHPNDSYSKRVMLCGVPFDLNGYPDGNHIGLTLTLKADTLREGIEMPPDASYTGNEWDPEKAEKANEIMQQLSELVSPIVSLRMIGAKLTPVAMLVPRSAHSSYDILKQLGDRLEKLEVNWEEERRSGGLADSDRSHLSDASAVSGTDRWENRLKSGGDETKARLSDDALLDIAALIALNFPKASMDVRRETVQAIATIVTRDWKSRRAL